MPKKPLQFYLAQRYPITIYPAKEGGYVAEIKDLPGCLTQGETFQELGKRIREARQAWIEVTYEANEPIPLPSETL